VKGRVKRIETGAVNGEIALDPPGGLEIVSIVTKRSAEGLGLTVGTEAYAMIKASSVMIGVDH
jgi:molybdopterin-binding protein